MIRTVRLIDDHFVGLDVSQKMTAVGIVNNARRGLWGVVTLLKG